jgi:hypothetical protein
LGLTAVRKLCIDTIYDNFTKQRYLGTDGRQLRDQNPMHALFDQFSWELSTEAQLGRRYSMEQLTRREQGYQANAGS